MPNVKVLLKDNVEKLGDIGEIVSVKPGYARNFLLPQGLATIPSIGEMRQVEKKKEQIIKLYKEAQVKAEEIVKSITEIGDLVISTKAGEAGKLFGSITVKDITAKINEKLSEELKIDKKQVQLKRAITDVGEFMIKIKLHPEVSTEVKVVIKGEE